MVMGKDRLDGLDERVVGMGIEAGTMMMDVFRTMNGSATLDLPALRRRDIRLHDLEQGIENRCVQLLLKENLFGSDFRQVAGALKVIHDLERIGHQSLHVGQILAQNEDPVLYWQTGLHWMAHHSAKMVLEASLAVRPVEKLEVNVGYELRADRVAYGYDGTEMPEAISLGDASLLSVSARYSITPALDVFTRGDNLLGSDYYMLPGVRAQGLHGLVGASFKF